MSKQARRWPIWKIAVSAGLWAIGAALLVWLSIFTENLRNESTGDATPDQISSLTLPTLIMGFGVGAGVMCVISLIWMGLRIRDAKIPPWEKQGKRKRR